MHEIDKNTAIKNFRDALDLVSKKQLVIEMPEKNFIDKFFDELLDEENITQLPTGKNLTADSLEPAQDLIFIVKSKKYGDEQFFKFRKPWGEK